MSRSPRPLTGFARRSRKRSLHQAPIIWWSLIIRPMPSSWVSTFWPWEKKSGLVGKICSRFLSRTSACALLPKQAFLSGDGSSWRFTSFLSVASPGGIIRDAGNNIRENGQVGVLLELLQDRFAFRSGHIIFFSIQTFEHQHSCVKRSDPCSGLLCATRAC